MNNIINGLYVESGLSGTTGGPQIFASTLPSNSFISKWLSFNTQITNPLIIDAIANQKIKISLKINQTCSDFCVLIDNIVLDKNCTSVEKNNIFLTQSPGFELDRIRDNKKSWVSNSTLTNRPFSITNNIGVNPIRQTNYDVNDERLVINSKEIDLDISLASAIETDVWCYLVDNPCLLTGTSTCNPCVEIETICCGDNRIDFNDLLTQPLSGITTIEDFEYFLSSELIDVKNRKILSSYPTLRALYDRYMNSSIYCGNNSSKFDYLTMEQFANLVGDYWVDIVEQVIPATTIWGSVKILSNNMFDQQKFKYKSYSSLFCTNPFSGDTVLSPINGIGGSSTNVEVIMSSNNIVNDNELSLIKPITTTCNTLAISQMNSGSEFIGTVTIIGAVVSNSNND